MLVCRRQRGCGGGCMGASVCVRTCVLRHVAATVPELACSHDKRCTPNLSGCARRLAPGCGPMAGSSTGGPEPAAPARPCLRTLGSDYRPRPLPPTAASTCHNCDCFKQDSCSIYNTGTNTSHVLSDQGMRGFLGCKSCMLTRFRGRLGRERICMCAFVPLFLSMACECFILVCCTVWGCAATIGHHDV
jgi:hypothetical protein